MKIEKQLINKLIDIVGEDYVSTDEFELWNYSVTASLGADPMKPDIIVKPGSTEEVSQIIKLANIYKTPVVPRGGGSDLDESALAEKGGVILDMTRLNRVLEIYEDLRAVLVEAGVTFGKLDSALSEKGWMFPILPMSSLSSTLGGNVSDNGFSPGSATFGNIAEQVLGLTVVTPTGEILKTGSMACPGVRPYVRNVFGPDITGLFIGAQGTLGVITEVALKIYRKPEETRYLSYAFDPREKTVKFINEVRAMDILVLDSMIFDEATLTFYSRIVKSLPVLDQYSPGLSLAIGGRAEEIDLIEKRLDKLAESLGGKRYPELNQFATDLWEDILNWAAEGAYGLRMNWIIGYHALPIERFFESHELCIAITDEENLKSGTNLMCGVPVTVADRVGKMMPLIYFDPADEKERQSAIRARNKIMESVSKIEGVPFRVGRAYKDYVPASIKEQIKKIKAALDPNNIMNPGIWG